MKGFINVMVQGGLNRLIAVDKIIQVLQLENGNAFIVTEERKHAIYGVNTVQDYFDVLDKINEAVQ